LQDVVKATATRQTRISTRARFMDPPLIEHATIAG
jgi:hypothetical protein